MSETKLNILPVPTFSSLGVNYAERNIKEYETEFVTIPSDESRTLIRYTDSGADSVETLELNVESGAKVKLVQVFERSEPTVSKLKAVLGDSAELELVQIYIGGSDTVSETVTELRGARAYFSAEIAAALGSGENLDINLIAEHRGRKSVSEINLGAVLDGSARKTFKGTIDFKKGASGAKGSEHEDALLLSESVRSRTVPVILCEEEDVEGSHGATVGRLDERHIFYLRSRGISEDKIYELMGRAKLKRAIEKIGDKQTESRIYAALGWSDDDEQE